MENVIFFVIGLACGAFLVRYGIGIGAKLIYQTKEDLPLLTKEPGEVESPQGMVGEGEIFSESEEKA